MDHPCAGVDIATTNNLNSVKDEPMLLVVSEHSKDSECAFVRSSDDETRGRAFTFPLDATDEDVDCQGDTTAVAYPYAGGPNLHPSLPSFSDGHSFATTDVSTYLPPANRKTNHSFFSADIRPLVSPSEGCSLRSLYQNSHIVEPYASSLGGAAGSQSMSPSQQEFVISYGGASAILQPCSIRGNDCNRDDISSSSKPSEGDHIPHPVDILNERRHQTSLVNSTSLSHHNVSPNSSVFDSGSNSTFAALLHSPRTGRMLRNVDSPSFRQNVLHHIDSITTPRYLPSLEVIKPPLISVHPEFSCPEDRSCVPCIRENPAGIGALKSHRSVVGAIEIFNLVDTDDADETLDRESGKNDGDLFYPDSRDLSILPLDSEGGSVLGVEGFLDEDSRELHSSGGGGTTCPPPRAPSQVPVAPPIISDSVDTGVSWKMIPHATGSHQLYETLEHSHDVTSTGTGRERLREQPNSYGFPAAPSYACESKAGGIESHSHSVPLLDLSSVNVRSDDAVCLERAADVWPPGREDMSYRLDTHIDANGDAADEGESGNADGCHLEYTVSRETNFCSSAQSNKLFLASAEMMNTAAGVRATISYGRKRIESEDQPKQQSIRSLEGQLNRQSDRLESCMSPTTTTHLRMQLERQRMVRGPPERSGARNTLD